MDNNEERKNDALLQKDGESKLVIDNEVEQNLSEVVTNSNNDVNINNNQIIEEPNLENDNSESSLPKDNTKTDVNDSVVSSQISMQQNNNEVDNNLPNEQDLNVSLNGKEQVIYEYKPKKSTGPLPIIIFFVIIGAIILFLPNIQEAVVNIKNGRISNTSVNSSNDNSSNNQSSISQDDNTKENEFYQVASDTVISIDKLTLTNFAKTKDNSFYYLTFTIENKDNSPYEYKDNIYILMYSNKEYLKSALIEDTSVLSSSSKKQLKLIIPEAVYVRDFEISVKKLDESDYNDVELSTNLKEQQELICTQEGRTITYTFLNNELMGIEDQQTESKVLYDNIETYNNKFELYRTKSSNYNMISGITSNINITENGFDFYVNIDPNTVTSTDLNTINDRAYYIGKTKAKIIAYEMQARGYSCK